MVIVPNSRIRLLKCPIEMDNENQLTFANLTAQTNYFLSLTYLEETNCTYQRKDGVIRFETDPDGITFEDLLKYNYVMYQNTSYSNKWFYAFIKNIKYVNDGLSEITIETDTFQSWQFSIVYKRTFVEREHVNNDTLGLHTVPEHLELGPYVVNSYLVDSYNNQLCIVVGSTEDFLDNYNFGVNIYNGIPGPLYYYRYNLPTGNSTGDMQALADALAAIASAGKTDAIVSMFLCPTWLAASYVGTTKKIATSNTYASQNLGISRISTLNGYTPKNNKLLCWPFCYIALSNGVGQYSIYHQEDWTLTSNEMKVGMYGSLVSGCSIRAVPLNYKGADVNWDEGISLGKFPALAWPNDIYTNWLTQNGVNIFGITLNAEQKGLLGGAVQSLAGAYAGNYNQMGQGIGNMFETLKESYQMDIVPTGVKGSLNSGDIATSFGANRLHAFRVTIKQEYAKIIDKFFSAYGYKVNDFKTPNITGRTNWNYVKTINCNIEGEIPQEDIQKLKSMFNNGVTFWHNPTTFLDYSQNNTIVT